MKQIRIALAGNPNCGKTTLFNILTGSNQFVGNWPGVTVEKKEGKLKRHDDVIITDLPGIYSLSPYTLEEVVARNYLVDERPDAILNIVDGTNIERNLYLTTQLSELGIPVVVAVNMMDVVRKNGDFVDFKGLSAKLNCPVAEISALKGDGVFEAVEIAIAEAKKTHKTSIHFFSGVVEHALAHIEEAVLHDQPKDRQRWYAIKLFERDSGVREKLNVDQKILEHIDEDIRCAEAELDDDAESIITNERYIFVDSVLDGVYRKHSTGKLSPSERIDRVVTNRFAALPIFAFIMFLVYFISVTTVGNLVTGFTNDSLFGDGWHLFGIGSGEYSEAVSKHAEVLWSGELENIVDSAVLADVAGADEIMAAITDKSYTDLVEAYDVYGDALAEAGYGISHLLDQVIQDAPTPDGYGVWVLGIPVLVERGLDAVGCADWLKSLVLDGIVGGVGAVLGFVPQMLVLFLLLAFLEACGYMSRVAFVLDKVFRKFGLSGKSFIPLLIGTGCGVPGIMASRTIENLRDRRMTVITTTFVPCGAKLPVIALIASLLFDGAWWVAPSAYFLGIGAVVVSGIILKKTKPFLGEVAPFVMELPAYHMPTLVNLLRSMWERGFSFIKKAGTVILISSVIIWAGSSFGVMNGAFTFSLDMPLESSALGFLGRCVAWMFAPLGFGSIKAAVATLMGLIAKEEIVGVFGVLDFGGMTKLSAYSFLAFNLLCAPCVAAIGAIRREMNSARWTLFAIGYQCGFAYAVSLIIYQLGMLFSGNFNFPTVLGAAVAVAIISVAVFLMVRPVKYVAQDSKHV